jgi:replication factor C subunit 2/4
MSRLLVEKYRPRNLDNFIGNKDIVNIVKNFIKEKHIPHLIINGSPSTGKTSLVHIIINSLFEQHIIKERVLEVNASEDRGIRVIRNKIKKYVTSSINNIESNACFKIIILDEADTLSMDSQYALRRIIEDSSKSTRFILVCNNMNTIIPPIISRCMVLNLKQLENSEIKNRLMDIVDKEKINITEEKIDDFIKNCNNDIRQAISKLQKYSSGILSDNKLNEIDWSFIKNNNSKFILNELNEFLLNGHEVTCLIENLVEYIKKNNISNLEKFLNLAIDTCIRLKEGCTPIIQLSNLVFFVKTNE